MISRIPSDPPLFQKGVKQGGFAIENMLPPEIPKIPQNFFAPSARFYYYFLLYFSQIFMFLTPETIVLALVFHFFRACGALFLFQTFCACVENVIAARKSNMIKFLPRQPHCKKRFVHV